MSKAYGKVFVFYPAWIFSTPLIFVSDIKAIRQILVDTKTFMKGADYTLRFSVALGNGLVNSTGETHRKQRMNVAKYFGKTKINEKMNDVQRIYYQTMESQGLASLDRGGEPHNIKGSDNFDIYTFFHLLTLRTVFDIMMDHDTSLNFEHEQQCCRDASYFTKVLGQRVFFKLPMWSFDPQVKYIVDTTNDLFYNLIDKVIDKRYATYGPDLEKWPDNAMRALLMAPEVSRRELHEQLTTILIAGFETTAAYLSYASYRIAKYPRVQDKIREEIKEVMGNRTNVTAEDLDKFSFLSAVLKESMRWLAIVPAVTRVTTKDTVIKMEDSTNIKLPEGSNVLIPFYLPNFDEDIWDEPNKFIPERMDKIPDPGASVKHGYLPFGYGTRTCIGNYVAHIEAVNAFVHLLQEFKFELVPGFRPIPTFGMSTTSSNGMQIKLVTLESN